MAFPFNPHTDRPSLEIVNPPLEQYPYFQPAGPVAFDPDATAYVPANAWLLAETSLLAYAEPTFIASTIGASGPPALPGFQFKPLGEIPDSGCFLLQNGDVGIVAFRGTRVPGLQDPLAFLRSLSPHFRDVVTDVQFQADDFGPGRVHHGFLDAYRRLFPEGQPDLMDLLGDLGVRKAWFTGHSLGGGLATVAAARFGAFQGLYTYGCPRVGDAAFAALFAGKTSFRVVHHDDAVARLPPPFPVGLPPIRYEHLDALVFLDREGRVSLDTDPGSLSDVFAGVINWQDVLQGLARSAGELGSILGSLGGRLLDVKVPSGPVTDHAPIYYAMYLKEAAQGL